MKSQVEEAVRQILDDVSDIQATTIICGLPEANSRLADIREKAASIFEGNKGAHTIVAEYESDADKAMVLLTEAIYSFLSPATPREKRTDADRLLILRLAELVVQRNRVYFEHRKRSTYVNGKGAECLEENVG